MMFLEGQGTIRVRRSESRKEKNIQLFVPRAVELTGMMEACAREERKENLV